MYNQINLEVDNDCYVSIKHKPIKKKETKLHETSFFQKKYNLCK